MLTKISLSWSLFTASLQVAWQNKKLLIFPLVVSACSVVMLLFFLAPALLYPSGHSLREAAHWQTLGQLAGFDFDRAHPRLHPSGLFYAYVAAIYLVSMFTATFFNVALYQQILEALAGRPVSVRAGLRFASQRLGQILMWSLFAGAVGLIIQAIEERLGWVGSWLARLVGMAWSVASVFAIPVLIRETSANPITLLRSSATTLRQTWGEALVGYVGITLGSWLVLLGSLALLTGAFLLTYVVHSAVPFLLVLIAWLGGMVLLAYFSSVAGHVYRCALYVYASEGVVPAPYDASMMDSAWKVKKD